MEDENNVVEMKKSSKNAEAVIQNDNIVLEYNESMLLQNNNFDDEIFGIIYIPVGGSIHFTKKLHYTILDIIYKEAVQEKQ